MPRKFCAKSKLNRILANFGTSFFKSVLTAIVGFVVSPYLIKFVGDESFGVYKLIFDWLSNVWLFDLGVSGAFLALGGKFLREGKKKDFILEGVKRHIKVLPYMGAGCLIFYFLLVGIIKFETLSLANFTMSYVLASLSFICFPLNVCRQYFEVLERSSLINIIITIQLILTNILALFFAYIGMGLLGLCLAYSIGIILSNLVILKSFYQTEGYFPFGSKTRHLFDTEFKMNSKSSWKISISQKVSFLADNSIIAYFYAPKMVTAFFISQRLASLFQNQLQGVAYSIWASLVEIWSSGNKEHFRNKLLETMNLSFILSNFLFIIIYILNQKFVTVWIGSKYFLGHGFNLALGLLMIVNVFNFFYGHILSSTGFLKEQANTYLGLGALNLILSIILVQWISYVGPILASLITMGCLSLYKLFLMRKVYDLSLLKVSVLFIKNLVFTLGAIFLTKTIPEDVFTNDWLDLLFKGIIFAFFYFSGALVFLLTTNERKLWMKRFQSILLKIKS